jgi:hypothetical protein
MSPTTSVIDRSRIRGPILILRIRDRHIASPRCEAPILETPIGQAPLP